MYRFRYVVTTQPETVFYADYIAKRKINEILLRKQLKNRRIHDIINLLYSEIKRYEKIIKKVCVLLVLAAIITLTGCSDCKTSPGNTQTLPGNTQISPEITGEADDGLYLYSGNMRYTSDYENGEELITSVDIDGVTYNDIEFFDALYIGDNAY